MSVTRHIVALIALALVNPAARVDAQDSRPNIVFILADDLGWGDLGCFGNNHVLTPRLDQMAYEGMRFTQFYVASPVCSPTRAAFMTGRFPSELGIHTALLCEGEWNEDHGMPDWLSPQYLTVTELLHDAGYAVGVFGKWHLGCHPSAPDPGSYGVDDHATQASNGPRVRNAGTPYFRAHSTEYIVDEAIEFIEQNSDGPFMLNVWTILPHSALDPTPEQLSVYAHLAPSGGVPWVGAWQIYYATITAIDEQIGRLLDRIEDLGLTDNTIVIFTSDNGPAGMYARPSSHSGVGTGGAFRGKKWSLYEGGVRMPLIVRWPGHVPAGRVDDTSVISIVDLLPTFSTLAEAPLVNGPLDIEGTMGNPGLDGEDMSDVLLGTPRARVTPLMWEYRFTQMHLLGIHRSPLLAIRDGTWKLLLNPDLSRVELYDVVSDTWELHNRADDHPEVVAQLATAALVWHESLPVGPYANDAGANVYPWPQSVLLDDSVPMRRAAARRAHP